MSESEETAQNFTLNSIDEALEAIRTAGMVIVVDDADRENEGDLICSAEMISLCLAIALSCSGSKPRIET